MTISDRIDIFESANFRTAKLLVRWGKTTVQRTTTYLKNPTAFSQMEYPKRLTWQDQSLASKTVGSSGSSQQILFDFITIFQTVKCHSKLDS